MIREFLQLAHDYNDHDVRGWYVSEKLDGQRAWWDGGISRGILKANVPWANTAKDHIRISPPIATGLWSRYGHPIQAPDWFLDQLPPFPVDGELWAGRKNFQLVSSVVRQLEPDERWRKIQYKVFDAPSYREVMQDGEIRNKKNFMKTFDNFLPWCLARVKMCEPCFLTGGMNFEEKLAVLASRVPHLVHTQWKISDKLSLAREQLTTLLADVEANNGEGLIVRAPDFYWVPKRVNHMLKVKAQKDAEATVVGYIFGDETDLGSKHRGRMGSLIVGWNGLIFKLSGFNDEERMLSTIDGGSAYKIAYDSPKGNAPACVTNPKFPRGSTVTFQYRELTNDGVPKEARYWRKHECS